MSASRPIQSYLVLLMFSLATQACAGGGGDEEEEEEVPLECCMLLDIVDHCGPLNPEWKTIGESGDADACKRYVDERIVGCVGGGTDYREGDALIACAE